MENEVLMTHIKSFIETHLTESELRLVSKWADEKRYAKQRELEAKFN
jgi:hypothetical protein